MSDDAAFVVRAAGVDRFTTTRHGGSYIDSGLLSGPERFLEEALSHRPAASLRFDHVLSGVALIDVDASAVWFWSSQAVLRSALGMRVFLRLLEPDWPGWSLEWMLDPTAVLSRLLPGHEPPHRNPWPLPVRDFAVMQEEAWTRACAQRDLSALIASEGEATVRSWFEDDHTSVAVLVDGDRVHEVTLVDGMDSALLRAGADAIEVLRARPHLPIEDGPTESRIDSAFWIEPSRRRLRYWFLRPSWLSPPFASGGWEQWHTSPMPGGVLELVARLGRDPRAMIAPGDIDSLRRSARYLLAADSPRWARLDAILAEEARL